MNKITPYDDYYQNSSSQQDIDYYPQDPPPQKRIITYDDIMQRLTNQFIKPTHPKLYPSTSSTSQPQYTQKPTTSNVKKTNNVVDNNSRMPQYVKAYPINKPLPKKNDVVVSTVPATMDADKFAAVLNSNANTMRKIAVHNNNVSKLRSKKSNKMLFQ